MIFISVGALVLLCSIVALMSREIERQRHALNLCHRRLYQLTEDYPSIGIMLTNVQVNGCREPYCILGRFEGDRTSCECHKDPAVLLYAARTWRSLFGMAYKPSNGETTY